MFRKRSVSTALGQPVSEIDEYCRDLVLAYREIRQTTKTCNPYKTGYKNKDYFTLTSSRARVDDDY